MSDHKNIIIGYPPFPEEFREYLPKGYTMLNVDKKCVCHECAPRLWAYLYGKADENEKHEDGEEEREDSHQSQEESTPFPPKSLKRKRQPGKDSKVSRPKLTNTPSELNQIRRSCDYRVPVALLEAHLKQFSEGLNLTEQQLKALQSFEKAFDQFNLAREAQDVKLLPKPRQLCEPLDELFFDGCLASLKYSWSGESSTAHQSTHMGEDFMGTMLHNNIGLPRIIKLNDVVHLECDQSELEVISTILHEMVHAFLGLYLCNGRPCLSKRIGSKDIALCKYMNARSVSICGAIINSRGDDMKIIQTSLYAGHGPVFQHIYRCIKDHALDVVGYSLPPPSAVSERSCKCREKPPRCFFHCYDSYEEMQRKFWEEEVGPLSRGEGEESGEEESREEEKSAEEESAEEESAEEESAEEESAEEESAEEESAEEESAEEESAEEESAEEESAEEESAEEESAEEESAEEASAEEVDKEKEDKEEKGNE